MRASRSGTFFVAVKRLEHPLGVASRGERVRQHRRAQAVSQAAAQHEWQQLAVPEQEAAVGGAQRFDVGGGYVVQLGQRKLDGGGCAGRRPAQG